MSDIANKEYVDYYGVYGPSRFRGRNGKKPSKRLLQKNIKVLNLPVAKIGWTTLIVPSEGDAQIAKFARGDKPEQPPRRGPGRPRKYQNGNGA